MQGRELFLISRENCPIHKTEGAAIRDLAAKPACVRPLTVHSYPA